MRLLTLSLIGLFLLWIISLKFADKIGLIFIKYVINPIKDLFK